MKPRPEGVIGVEPKEPTGALYLEAQRRLKAKADRAAARKEKRDSQPVPNHVAYRNIVFFVGKNIDENGRWLGGILPPCKVCGDRLPPGEHHICSGFVPKFKEHTKESHERWEAEREEIRETRRAMRGVFCTECGDLLEDPEDAQWHAEDHGGKAQRNHYAVDGEHDGDLDGYDDEPEEDYCDEDDGHDCD